MKHPVRPQSYMEIRNFYTMTVYEKGAEVVRMQHTLLGEEKFQAGMRLYFQRHDGQAVTCDDFVQAMQDASGVDLGQFRRWYDVAGTPVLDCSGEHRDGTFTLRVKQSMNPPFHIPLAVKIGQRQEVLSLRKAEETFSFKVQEKPVPSLLRGFSAPVILNYPYTEGELVHLLGHDDDAFNRWEAAQRLAADIILRKRGAPSPAFLDAMRRVLDDPDPAFAAEVLTLPSETSLAEQIEVVDPDALHASRNALRLAMASALKDKLLAKHASLKVTGPYSPEPDQVGRRTLRNVCLGYLVELGMTLKDLTATQVALGYPATLGVTPSSPVAFQGEGQDSSVVAATLALGWATPPTDPTDSYYFRRGTLQTTADELVLRWPSGAGLVLLPSISLVLYLMAVGSVLDGWITLEQ